ncbi:MAG: response regulator [Nitrospiraceae bacterium]|nr:MAG: response regulator [Nitrospiraceae bacterium]
MDKIKVLIADSTPTVRQFIKYALEDTFPNVVMEMANTGKNVRQRLEHFSFDLIIYDREMPLLGGDELLQWIRTHTALKSTPVLIMSASRDEESLKKVVRLGADDYLIKPLFRDHLISKVKGIFSKIGSAADRRTSPRYNPERAGFLLKSISYSSRGRLSNISMGGLSGALDAQSPVPHILDKVEVSIESEKQFAGGIEGIVIRLQVSDSPAGAQQMQLSVKFNDGMSDEKKKDLFEFVSSLKNQPLP